MGKVWIVMYTEDHTGIESIKGVFQSEAQAKSFVADYVLQNSVITEYLDLFCKELE